MNTLENKVAIITGGANGIGAEIVKECMKESVKFVAIIDINESLGYALEKVLRHQYGNERVRFFNIDVTNEEKMSEMFYNITKEFGAIDVIVNNAGIVYVGQKFFKKEIDINFTALVASSVKGLDLMRKDQGGKGGTIINISSITALSLLSPSVLVYGATKSAVLHFSNCLGLEEYFRLTNVRVMTVCFGATKTDIIYNVEGLDEVNVETMKKMEKLFSEQKSLQTPLFAAQGVIQSFKSGNTGSTWLVDNNKITDITNDVHEGYKIMSKNLKI